jgi:hypothetical protein
VSSPCLVERRRREAKSSACAADPCLLGLLVMQQPPNPLAPSPYQKIAYDSGSRFCPSCGGVGEPRRENRGTLLVEILLWLLCVPGLIYSYWRRSNKIEKCAYCSSPGVLPVDSPEAQAIRAGRS